MAVNIIKNGRIQRTIYMQVSQLVLGLCIVSCGYPLPTDEEMKRHFLMHEQSFDELCEIISQRSCGSYYPPFDSVCLDMSDSEEMASVAGLSPDDRSVLDSLLSDIGCKRVFYRIRTSADAADKDTTGIRIEIPYFSQGISISGVSKDFLYEPERDEELMPLTESSLELNDVCGWRDTILYKSIKGDWYIRLWNEL